MKKRKFLLLAAIVSLFYISAFAQTTYVNGLVVVVRYNDYKINATTAQIDAMLNQETGFNLWGNTTSVKQFYKTQSDGKFILTSTVVDVDLNQSSSYYLGPNLPYDGGQVLARDVVSAVRAKYPAGFSGLTVHPTDDRLWHFSIISQSAPSEGKGVAYGLNETQYIRNNGIEMPIRNVGLISYTITDSYEVSVICHEYGHSIMGWTDYYRTAFSNLGDYDVMASAGTTKAPMPVNPGLRLQKNWIGDVVTIAGTSTATYTLTSNSYSQIHKYTNPNNPKEYLLFHALKHGGYYQPVLDNGKVLDEGLAIWYVDEDGGFDLTGVEKQYMIRLVQADNKDEMHDERTPNYSDIRGDLDDLYDNISNSFPNGTPFRWKDGGEFGISISNISAPGATMSFTVNARPNTVVAYSDLNGNISPKGTFAALSGENKTFTFIPNPGYELDAILVNGIPVDVSNPYTLSGISGTKTIKATFRKKTTIDPVPSPWVSMQVGNSTQTGFATSTSGKLSIECYGTNLGGTTDNFGYVFQTINGDGAIVAKLNTSNLPSFNGRFGLMVRESLQSNSTFSMISKVPFSGASVQQRDGAGSYVVDNPSKTDNLHIYSLFSWLKISRQGNLFTTSCSKDGVSWEVLSQQTISMNNSVYIGVFATGALDTYPAKATFESVTVTTANPSPTVSITSPLNNATFASPATIVINANAADANGSITKVDFYNGTDFLGSDNTAPYSFTWTNVRGGKYILTAKATDNQLAYTTSVPVLVSVPCSFTETKLVGTVIGTDGSWNDYGNTKEKAFDGDINTFFDANVDIAWTGLTLNNNYKVTGIKYYPRADASSRMVGGRFQGSNTADFSSGVVDLATIQIEPLYEWNCFTITNTSSFRYLRYICAAGGVGNVSEIEFYGTEVINNIAPIVSITSPVNNTSYSFPVNLGLAANASDSDGTITKVEFYNGSNSVPIATDLTSPYNVTWSNVPAGTYTITAKATDNLGAVTISSAVTFTVTNTSSQTPYGGTAWPIPGTIEAENYDYGGQSIAFNDVTTANQGGAFRTDAVDIETTAGGYNVGYIATDEWLEYTVNVSAGMYSIEARVAATAGGKTFRVELDGTSIASFTVPNTGGWQVWQSTFATGVSLTAGQKVLRIYATSSEFNIDKVIFTKSNAAPSVSITSPANNTNYNAPATINIAANASDVDGTISKVEFFNGSNISPIGTDLTSPYTFSWTNVATGTYVVTAKATDNNGAITTSASVTVTVTNPSTQSPYGGIAQVIPGTIEAEKYDVGGQGIAFNDLSATNDGGAFRTDAVDIEACSAGGYNVGWIATDEWLEYTVNITNSGLYNIDARVATINSAKTFRLELDGVPIANLAVPNTGNWQVWQSVQVNNISLNAGQKVLRVYATSNDFNIDKIIFNLASAASLMIPQAVPVNEISNSPNPFADQTTFTLDVVKEGEVSVKIYDTYGMLKATVFEGYVKEGSYEYIYNTSSLIPGTYMVRLVSTCGVISKPILKQ